MWPFTTKTSYLKSGIFSGFTDWHSHILPGVDDGIETTGEALHLLKEYEQAGIKKVWLTPHIMEDIPNTTASLKEKFQILKEEWKGNVEIKLASENMIDPLFEQRLQSDDFLPIGDTGTHLLLETSCFTPPYHLEDIFSSVTKKGYKIILAHPERYAYMEEKDYRKLKSSGIMFQMNLISLIGGYGKIAKKRAEWLMDNDYVDLIGTDIHRTDYFSKSFRDECLNQKMVRKLLKIHKAI